MMTSSEMTKEERELLEYLFKEAETKEPSAKEKAKKIFWDLESDPDVFREFNLLLRKMKIKKIKNG